MFLNKSASSNLMMLNRNTLNESKNTCLIKTSIIDSFKDPFNHTNCLPKSSTTGFAQAMIVELPHQSFSSRKNQRSSLLLNGEDFIDEVGGVGGVGGLDNNDENDPNKLIKSRLVFYLLLFFLITGIMILSN
ncbi:hypothetical protein QR98_0034100 [Sarcoptes scabiei]|uniref:Uncharacterized protein n=1 Tax=Sarcoptes scabiei TaxID=52283 RepID=A0A132A1Z5_SARSC|nr:hypothetical protein QR98_0034100 [Sarcoptes scabiei]